jgi:capsular polysaccharide biosynthesis protein
MISRTRTSLRQRLEAAFPFTVITLAVFLITWMISMYQTPTYEASIKILVGQTSTPWWESNTGEPSVIRVSIGDVSDLQNLAQTVANAADTPAVAQAVVEQLNLPKGSAEKVLKNMSVEQDPGTMLINISYTSTDPAKAQQIANAIGQVLSEKASKTSVGDYAITAKVWEPAKMPKTPVSPKPVRNMLLAGATWGLILGLLITARALWSQENLFAVYPAGEPRPALEGAKEQQLLEALYRAPSGELTAAEAALESSLTVEEADRMLSRLSAKGHLRVRVSETGGVFYSFWQRS